MVQALSFEDLLDLHFQEVRLIDIRPATAYTRGHLKGSQNMPFLKDHELPKGKSAHPVIIGAAGAIAPHAAGAWENGGHEVAGDLDGLYTRLEAAMPKVLPSEQMIKWCHRRTDTLLDVRLLDNHRRGFFRGSVAIPLPGMSGKLAGSSRNIPILVYCGGRGEGVSGVCAMVSGRIDDCYRLNYPIPLMSHD